MNKKVSLAFQISLEFYNKVASKRLEKNLVRETINPSRYMNESLDIIGHFVANKFSMVQCDVFDNLSHRATTLVIKIIKELKTNNALWEFDHTKNARDQKAITELRNEKILYRTETTHIHYVNPLCLRRGTPANVAFKTMNLLRSVGKVNTDHIKSLSSKSLDSPLPPPDMYPGVEIN